MTDEQLFADVPHPAETAAEPPPGDDFEPEAPRTRGPSPFVQGLNPEQLDAVVHDTGPLLVVAGAGTARRGHEKVPPSGRVGGGGPGSSPGRRMSGSMSGW